MIDLTGKIALVTGAGRGIGKGCAVEAARCGAEVVVNDRPGSEDAQQTVAEIENAGGKATMIGANVFSRDGCEELVQRAIQEAGHLDIVISNPAFGVRCPFLEYDPQDFERVIGGTLIAGFHISQLVGRHLVERGQGGKIVFISSVQAEMALAQSCAYNASKAGLNHLARTIAVELFPHRVNVNVIEPGWIDTPGEHEAFGDDAIQQEAPKLPWGRLGTPQDIGAAAAFLSSSSADYITGAVLAVDGGFRLKDYQS